MTRAPRAASLAVETELRAALDELERHASEKTRLGLGRYGIVAPRALGVSVADVRALGKQIGTNHALAHALWATGVYEARLLVAFVADPAELTVAEMDRWCRDFDNWAVCDTLCFALFDRSEHAFARVRAWAPAKAEFVKRAAFALLASLALHDRQSDDAAFVACLPLIEAAASDERNFVKKGVSWALRAVGARSRALHAASLALAEKLAAAGSAERWVGKDALRDLMRSRVRAGLAAREARRSTTQGAPRSAAKTGGAKKRERKRSPERGATPRRSAAASARKPKKMAKRAKRSGE